MRDPMKAQLQSLFRKKPAALAIASLFYLAVVGCDFLSPELNVAPFYLLNVLFVSWSCGRWWGMCFAVLCAATEIWLGWIIRFPYSTTAFLYVNVFNRLVAYAIVVWLTSQLRGLYEQGLDTARRDFLTGAANRMAFYEALGVERARQRRSRKPLSIAYIDCDNFKAVNDRLGHGEGDKVLKAIVSTARTKLRETDTIARLGGDEFGLILPETEARGAAKAISALRDALKERMQINGWDVSFSIGLGTFISLSESLDELVSLSDALMYEAKRKGKDTVVQREYAAPESADQALASLGAPVNDTQGNRVFPP
jgi:diguanylate cyclase (GGDEF)-like protein